MHRIIHITVLIISIRITPRNPSSVQSPPVQGTEYFGFDPNPAEATRDLSPPTSPGSGYGPWEGWLDPVKVFRSFPGTPRCCRRGSGRPQARRNKKLLSKEQSDNNEITPNHSSAATNLSQMKSQAGVRECFQKGSCLFVSSLQAGKPDAILGPTHIPATGLCLRPQELDAALLLTKVPFCNRPL